MSAVPTRSENASTGIGYSARWWCNATIQRAFGCASRAPVRRWAWPAAIKPSALVKEKFVSAFESRSATPSPSSSAGGTISGKRSSQSRARRADGRKPPASANASSACRCGSSAAASAGPGVAPSKLARRARSPWTAAMAESARILRSVLTGLNGRSSRAGLLRSTMLTSWLPGRMSARRARSG